MRDWRVPKRNKRGPGKQEEIWWGWRGWGMVGLGRGKRGHGGTEGDLGKWKRPAIQRREPGGQEGI